jgi:hypothetical protein
VSLSIFEIVGQWSAVPGTKRVASGDPDIPSPVDERLLLSAKHYDEITLTSDALTPVSFGGLSQAHVVVAKIVGRRVRFSVTSAAGSDQVVSVDSFFVLITETEPLTAISIQRLAGEETSVKLFLGEKQ